MGMEIQLQLINKLPPLLLTLAVLSISMLPSNGAHVLRGNATDRWALLSLRALISDDPSGALSTWNHSSWCHWKGVSCSGLRHPGRVTALELASLNLTGSIPPQLGNLTFLRRLNLSGNNFHGRIPPELGLLFRLRYLDLGYNSLQGETPVSLTQHCSELRLITLRRNNLEGEIPANLSRCRLLSYINFNYNGFTGSIPASLGLLSQLTSLILYANKLTGVIPSSLGNLTSLTVLDLDQNSLRGHIPHNLGRLHNLRFFILSVNDLSGEIPPSLFNISSIYRFNVGLNNLSGRLPSDMGNTLPRLQHFYVFYNQFQGSIPISLTNATTIQSLGLHGNSFIGTMPPKLGALPNLTTLDVGNNQLESNKAQDWEFITSLSNCSNLQILDFTINDFRGALPSSIANLSTQLRWLGIAGNNISGTIPREIGRLTGLTELRMEVNLFTGTIPSTIGMLQNLHSLDMTANMLEGEIPGSLGNLTQLNILGLSQNNFHGSIPRSFGNLSNLNGLKISYNHLDGTIPREVVSLPSLSQYLDLSNNLLSGSLPAEVGSLKNLVELDVSENRLSGVIPDSLGGCLILGQLYMQGNLLGGSIPLALGSLKGIQEMDLSSNNLSGNIPQFLEEFPLLNYLNLSFNNLDGPVPEGGVFRNSSAVSVVGNNKLCGGNPELHLQPCPLHKKSSRSHSFLHILIMVVVAILLLLLIIILVYCCVLKQRTKKSLSSNSLEGQHTKISYTEIHQATNGFSPANLIGQGSFGSVYKGILESGSMMVAIKVLDLQQRGANRSFMAECESLRTIRHRNLVNIITVCSSADHNGGDFKALVFEFMANGNLDEWLHPKSPDDSRLISLSLFQRYNIAMDVACALDYLHHHCHVQIVHCDLKPSNILLDADMTAHVGDFGLARFAYKTMRKSSQDPSSSIGLKGSIGYVAPEYGMGGKATAQGDVYSYGVLLLEMFSGKRPTDYMFQEDVDLRKYVETAYPEQAIDIMDPALQEEGVSSCSAENANLHREVMHGFVVSIFRLGLLCSQKSPKDRVDMKEVIKELLAIKKKFLEPGRDAKEQATEL